VGRSLFRTVTIHAYDRQTDNFLMARPRCMQCSTVKIVAESNSSQAVPYEQFISWGTCHFIEVGAYVVDWVKPLGTQSA